MFAMNNPNKQSTISILFVPLSHCGISPPPALDKLRITGMLHTFVSFNHELAVSLLCLHFRNTRLSLFSYPYTWHFTGAINCVNIFRTTDCINRWLLNLLQISGAQCVKIVQVNVGYWNIDWKTGWTEDWRRTHEMALLVNATINSARLSRNY